MDVHFWMVLSLEPTKQIYSIALQKLTINFKMLRTRVETRIRQEYSALCVLYLRKCFVSLYRWEVRPNFNNRLLKVLARVRKIRPHLINHALEKCSSVLIKFQVLFAPIRGQKDGGM